MNNIQVAEALLWAKLDELVEQAFLSGERDEALREAREELLLAIDKLIEANENLAHGDV